MNILCRTIGAATYQFLSGANKLLLSMVILLSSLTLCAQVEELQLARQFSQNGEPQKAADIYQKLYKQNNESFYSFYYQSLMSLKKFDEAESVTKKMMHKHPEDTQYAIALGSLYHEKGNQDKADAIYNDVIKNLPADQFAINNTAMQFYQAENIDYAIKAFLQGRKILHNDDLYSNEMVSLYRYKHDKVNMINEYLRLLLNHPDYITQAKNTMAMLFDGATDYDILKVALLKVIQQYPQETIFADLLTWQYLQQKQFAAALNQALGLNRRQNDGGASIFDLCQTLVSNMAYDEAIRGYEYVISKGSNQEYYIPAKIELLNTKNLK